MEHRQDQSQQLVVDLEIGRGKAEALLQVREEVGHGPRSSVYKTNLARAPTKGDTKSSMTMQQDEKLKQWLEVGLDGKVQSNSNAKHISNEPADLRR